MKKTVCEKYVTYDMQREYAQSLKEKYEMISLATAGKSLMEKDIIALCIGEGKRNVLYVGGTHGMEYVTTYILFKFAEELCYTVSTDENICGFSGKEICEKARLVIIPCFNPDGTDIALKGIEGCGNRKEEIYDICKFDFSSWNANANGVDLNHNFNADWYSLRDYEAQGGITGPSPRRFGGYYPESEPETKAIVEFLRKVHFHRLYSFHSQGEEIYYDYNDKSPEKSLHIAKMLGAVTDYTLVKNEGHCSSGGLKDWFIEEFKEPGFTIEVGKGENPLPAESYDEIYERVKPLLVLGLML